MPMERADRIGTGVSAALHLGVIAWAIFGGAWIKPKPTDPVTMTEVSVMSEADFAAMMAAAPKASPETSEAPAQPQATEAPQPTPEATPEPEVTPEPKPQQPPEPEPETAPDMTELTQPTPPAEVTEVPPEMMQPEIVPPVEVPQDTTTPDFSPRPVPKPAPRVAPKAAEAPAPDAKVSDMAEAETRPEEAPEPEPVVEPPKQEAAPPEATTEIVTEVTETEEKPKTSAPLSTPRPRSKPAKPAPEKPAEKTETAAAKPASDKPATDKPAKPATSKPAAAKPAATDAVNDALAEAMAGETEGTGGTGRAPSGPPVTSGEKEALIVDVKQCWNVGALSSEALRTTVTVRVSMNADGKPDIKTIKMVGYEGGSEAAAKQAYEAGRRAIVRCGSDGFPLPAEKYDHWREIEIVFNPEKMRMK